MAVLNKAAFKQYEGDSFSIHFKDGQVVSLTLEEVEAREHLDSEITENFCLLFSGPENQSLQQACFPLQHDKLGSHAVFLVPISQKEGRLFYEAVFSVSKQVAAS